MQNSPDYSAPKESSNEMNSLSMVMGKAVQNGYTESFKVTRDGLTPDSQPEQNYPPEQVTVVNFYRFEGESDPADNSIMYQIETPDGKKGVLVDAYGPYADEKTNQFMQQVEDIQKKVVKPDNDISNEDEKEGPTASAA
jgi:hypothetical protein